MKLEINKKFVRDKDKLVSGNNIFMITPSVGSDYWKYRVKLYKDQAIIGFPKFSTIGIGFAKEKDWNTNLPFMSNSRVIYNHIKHNKKYEEITEEECIEAIELIQKAVKNDC